MEELAAIWLQPDLLALMAGRRRTSAGSLPGALPPRVLAAAGRDSPAVLMAVGGCVPGIMMGSPGDVAGNIGQGYGELVKFDGLML